MRGNAKYVLVRPPIVWVALRHSLLIYVVGQKMMMQFPASRIRMYPSSTFSKATCDLVQLTPTTSQLHNPSSHEATKSTAMASSPTDGWTRQANAEANAEKPADAPAQPQYKFPSWALPLMFLLMMIYVEVAARYSTQPRKWYIITMILSNILFPWLTEHNLSPMLTAW